MPTVEVSPLQFRQIRVTGEVLARAFDDSPIMVHLLPRDRARTIGLRAFFNAALVDAHEHGEAWVVTVDGDIAGAGIWLPPGAYPPAARRQFRQLLHLLAVAPVAPLALVRSLRYLRKVEAVHPKTEHWYLATLGSTRPTRGRATGPGSSRRCCPARTRPGSPCTSRPTRNGTWPTTPGTGSWRRTSSSRPRTGPRPGRCGGSPRALTSGQKPAASSTEAGIAGREGHDRAGAAGPLGLEQRRVGGSQGRLGIGPLVDGRAHAERLGRVRDVPGRGNALDRRGHVLGRAPQDQDELVPAETGDDIVASDRVDQMAGDGTEGRVASVVAHPRVDAAQVVQIHDRHGVTGLETSEHLVGPPAVPDAGQGVPPRLVGQRVELFEVVELVPGLLAEDLGEPQHELVLTAPTRRDHQALEVSRPPDERDRQLGTAVTARIAMPVWSWAGRTAIHGRPPSLATRCSSPSVSGRYAATFGTPRRWTTVRTSRRAAAIESVSERRSLVPSMTSPSSLPRTVSACLTHAMSSPSTAEMPTVMSVVASETGACSSE